MPDFDAAFPEPRSATIRTEGKPVHEQDAEPTNPYQNGSVLSRALRALAHQDGYTVGLNQLGEVLQTQGPSRFSRFYYEEILGRSPEAAVFAQETIADPGRRIAELLCCAEFMSLHDIVLQKEFSHLSREFFLHVPKSGGTTTFWALASDERFCPIHLFPGFDNGWFTNRLEYLRETVVRLLNPQAQYVIGFGHPAVSRVLENNLKRGWDNVFTILRDPIETALSWVNYVLTQLSIDPGHPDVVSWRNILELPEETFSLDRHTVLELAPKIIERIVPGDPACNILGVAPRLGSVIETASVLGLKIIRFDQVDDYIRYRGVGACKRMNVSERLIEMSDLNQPTRLKIYDKNAEDLKLYDWVSRHGVPGEGPWCELK